MLFFRVFLFCLLIILQLWNSHPKFYILQSTSIRFSHFSCVTYVDLQNWPDIFHSGASYFPLTFCRGKRLFSSPEWKQKSRNLAVRIYLYSRESAVLNLHLSLTTRCKKLISQPHYAPTFVPFSFSDQNVFDICGCRIQLHHKALETLHKTEPARKEKQWLATFWLLISIPEVFLK